MSMIDYLKEEYGLNNPFLLEEIRYEDCTYETIKSMIAAYAKEGELRRYSQGVYYFPKTTVLGESIPSFESVINRKFICSNDNIKGYITGMSLLNQVGLTTQVPNVLEVTTNVEKNKKRTIEIRQRKIIVRKPTVEITNQNVKYLQFLDLFKYASLDMIKNNLDLIVNLFNVFELKLEELKRWANNYSKEVKKKIRESCLYDELAFG